MTTEACRTWVQANIDALAREFGLPHWRIKVIYGLIDSDPDYMGKCCALDGYERATIYLYPESFEDEAELSRVLEHELLHIHHSPFDAFYDAVRPFLNSEEARGAIKAVFDTACERTVRDLERLVWSQRNPAKSADLDAGGTL